MNKPEKKRVSSIRYFSGNPDTGGKELNSWEYIESMGLPDFFKEAGINIRPTHNVALLRSQRERLWEEYKEKRIHEADYFQTQAKAEESLRKDFLNNEISLFETFRKKVGGKHSDHIRSQVEEYLNDCRDEIEKLIEKLSKKTTQATGLSLNWQALYMYYADIPVIEKQGKLRQHYNNWIHKSERIGMMNLPSKAKVRTGIEKREKIIELLPKDKKSKAIDELSTFKQNYRDYITTE